MTVNEAGRYEQRTPIFTGPQRLLVVGGGGLLTAAVCWWAASALTGAADWSYTGFVAAGARVVAGDLPAAGTIVVFIMLTVTLTSVVVLLWRAVRNTGRAAAGMSDRQAVRDAAGEHTAREAARYTRRGSIAAGLDVDRCPVNEIGWQVGTSHGEPVVLDLQTQIAVVGPTGVGKTRYLLLNAAHDAPGALVITTTKLRDYADIITVRERLGRVLVWDPLEGSGYPDHIFWDPTRDAERSAVASARGTAFAGGMSEQQSDAGKFFGDACALIMTRLLMAGALDDRSMADVVRWGVHLQSAATEAISILRGGGADVWAETLESMISGDNKTTANMKMTLALKLEPLLDETVMRHMQPTAGFEEFDPVEFVRSTDTLIIVTDDNARTNVAPLSTMLLNEVMDAAKGYAAMHGALDPPLTVVGDEIANVAPLPKLPSMLSDSRGAGIRWVLAVQSLAQLEARWGEHKGKEILAALNGSLVLGGLQDSDALHRFSALAGKVDVVERSSSLNAAHVESGQQFSVRERDVFRSEEITQLAKGKAFLILRNAKPLIVDLMAHDER